MDLQLDALREEAQMAVRCCEDEPSLHAVRVQYLGKKGLLTLAIRDMVQQHPEQRALIGKQINDLKNALEAALMSRRDDIVAHRIARKLAEETIDVTLPGRAERVGAVHPLMHVIEEIEHIFVGMGYTVSEGPEVETDYYNFEALNIPEHHPARAMHDSFYIDDATLLRTQTSPVQIRTMQRCAGATPIKIICPGKVYRRDDDDPTHSHQFMQIEGLVVDTHVSMAHLRGTLAHFARTLFGPQARVRLRPSFFPFTEPSVEVDVSCAVCRGAGCRVCKQSGWVEVLGAGMVHPDVLARCGYDPTLVRAFAFGVGVERIAMLRYGIEDIRHFYANDRSFLQQFRMR
jgi:phenylalanyl-tRNA synthetase alpha chain